MEASSILIFIFSYLLGAIPFALVVGKVFYKTDVRQHGSGNPGATNTLRTLGPAAGISVLLLDIAKGVAPVLLAASFVHVPGLRQRECMAIAGALAVLGHVYSPFLRFRGGKGVATSTGVILALQPYFALIVIGLFILVVSLTRFVSLGSMLAVSVYSILMLIFYHDSAILSGFAVGLAALIVIKHRSNIQRLIRGEENKFGMKKSV